jgi:molecular chaperone HtpG
MDEEYEAPKKVLEINRKHPIVANLARILESNPDDSLLDVSIEQLFDNAQLMDGLLTDPAEMVARIQTLMESAVAAHVESKT